MSEITTESEEDMKIAESLETLKNLVNTVKTSYPDKQGDVINSAEKALKELEDHIKSLNDLIQELKDLTKIGDIYGPCEDSKVKLYGIA